MANPRADYLPIIDRAPLKLPGGSRIVVWVVVNVEDWDFNAPMARTVLPFPQSVTAVPDVANFSWYEYGLRVGFWRMKEVLDKHGIRATLSLNGAICETYPRIVEESLKSGWEIMGHSYVQRSLLLESDERSVIRKTVEVIEKKTGKAPRGWMGPGLGETHNTPEILVEEGIEYVADWVNDDLPYPLKVKNGSLFALPYTLELNDIPIYIVQHHRSPEIFERARDQFETLYREAERGARVMGIAVHPNITGAPHRIKYFEQIFDHIKKHEGVLFMTGSEILDWYKSATAAK
ncbi:MAG: polysaccharide deacetylase family protein [Terriglobia bacterium]